MLFRRWEGGTKLGFEISRADSCLHFFEEALPIMYSGRFEGGDRRQLIFRETKG